MEVIIGRSKAIKSIKNYIKKVAEVNYPVLIIGDTGVGKELVARSIHELGMRRKFRFYSINCASFSDHLFESELFGYRKGAFTDAKENKSGILDYIENGTLLLDEIAEASPDIQAKLLRLIENREARKLGDSKIFSTNARFLFSTNKDLFREIKEGKFRRDLYYRINTIKIFIPPLKERKDDIPLLIDYILKRESCENKLKSISQEAIIKLLSYDYPGNVRELFNIIKRAITLNNAGKICTRDILFDTNTRREYKDERQNDFKSLELILKKHNGNRTNAAKELGISRQWLHKLIKKKGIDIF